MNHQSQIQTDDKQRVRRNAGSAAIAAVFMLYFGFERLSEPTITDLFSKANWVFYHTVRIGGVAMAAIAVWSWIGHTSALIVDAVVSIVIGALFALTGVCMLIDGGGMFQTILNGVFGWMFYAAGVNNWSTYQEIKSNNTDNDMFSTHTREISMIDSRPQVDQIMEDQIEIKKPSAIEESQIVEEPPVVEESPGGFLASFADKKDPPQE